jgi:hypothetical protein
VILFDPNLDLAVLRPANRIGTPLQLRPDRARAGEVGIVVLPRLLGDEVDIEVADVTVVRSVDIDTTDILRDHDVVRPGFEIEGSIDPGDSGSMVVVPGGGVGIVWARSNQRANRAWAIDLPEGVIDGSTLEGPRGPVDVGSCPPP